MLKSDLLNFLNTKYPSLNNKDLELIVNLFTKKIIIGLKNNSNIELRGFGTFSKKINGAKYVRNPKTNEKFYKEEGHKVHFKIGKILHKKINSINNG